MFTTRNATLGLGAAALATLVGASGMQGGALAASQDHTMQFTVVPKAAQVLDGHFAGVDVNRTDGKVVGYDTITGWYDDTAGVAHIRAAMSRKNGLFYVSARQTDAGVVTGSVTGGTGQYLNAKGTVAGHTFGSRGKSKVTITWTK